MPKELLREIPRIVSEIIAYLELDVEFARRLKNDLEGRGVSC